MMNRLCRSTLFGLLLIVAMPTSTTAQIVQDTYQTQLCEFRRIGFNTMEVYALGAVEKNCKWTVEQGIDFLDFLAVVSPSGLATAETIDNRTVVSVHVYRTTPSGRANVYEAALDDIFVSEMPMPVLQDQDVVLFKVDSIRKRRIVTFNNVLRVISAMSTSLVLYLQLTE